MCDLMPALPRQDLSADDVAVVEPAVDERLEGAGHAQVRGEVLERRPRVLPDELVRVGRPREQHLWLGDSQIVFPFGKRKVHPPV